MRRCAFCHEISEGNYMIHRDGFGIGPEVDLCDKHGSQPSPSCDEIWRVIAINRKTRIKGKYDSNS